MKIIEIYSELCKKYSNFDPQIIKEVIIKFDYDVTKVDEHFRQLSSGHSSNMISSDYLRHNSNEFNNERYLSFVSMNKATSGSNSPVPSNKIYRPSNELSKISSQKVNLRNLTEAFKTLEKHRDFLNRESLYFGEVIQRRKLETDFPNINEIESLDKLVNEKYSIPLKLSSYANDLRKPDEINERFRGFHNVFNPQYNNNSKGKNGLNSDFTVLSKELNEDFLFRVSYEEDISESSVLEPTITWDCPICKTKNTLVLCTVCKFDYREL